jgi:hypothetical protein
MNTFLFILIGLALLSVAAVLVLGLVSMTKGGEFNKKYGNKLMQARVIMQGVAIVLVAILLFSAQK